jgi:hypothetical protein
MSGFDENIKTFSADHWPMKLDVPPGLRYVDTDDFEQMKSALQSGLGVFTSSCGGHVFLWRDAAGRFHGNHFFQGPPTAKQFDTIDDAIAFASRCYT